MSESDTYPPRSGRRRFVKGVVGAGALTGFGATTVGGVDLAAPGTGGGGGGETEFVGIENTDGPAPRAMPQLPVEIDDEGYLKGIYPDTKQVERRGQTITVVEQDLGGFTYSASWFQYCGIQNYTGLSPDYEGDNYLRYPEETEYEWQAEAVSPGDRVHVDDLADYEQWGNGIGEPGLGKPAQTVWRSEGTDQTIPVHVLRSTRIQAVREQAEGREKEWLEASSAADCIAWLNKCTHFCCTPGFKRSTQAAVNDAANEVYCQCHQSVYNPFSLVTRRFFAFPRRPG